MSRRPWGQRGRSGGGNSSPPPAVTITSVSQTAGTVNGGTIITVNGTGFTSDVTSTLGTATWVNSSTITIDTNAHIAGSFSWTITAHSVTSGPQTFTYLSHPVVSAITPNSGPLTISSTASVTCTGLPPTASGIAPAVAIGGVACTVNSWVPGTNTVNITIPANTTTGDVVVTVDTVASSGTVAWTANPPPAELSATNIDTNGGTGSIGGLYFVSGCTASVNINGTPTPLTITFLSSTSLQFTLASGTYTPSTGTGWPLTVTNPDTQSSTQSIFVITTEVSPATTMGANLIAWYRADSYATPTWDDLTGYAQNLTITGVPTYNSSDSNFNDQATVTWDGSTTYATKSGFSLQGGTVLWVMVIYRCTSSSTGPYEIASYSTTDNFEMRVQSSTLKSFWDETGLSISSGSTPANTVYAAYSYIQGGSPPLLGSLVGIGGTEVDATGSGTTNPQATGLFQISNRFNTGYEFVGQIAEVIVCNVKPNSSQYSALYGYANFRYMIDTYPTVIGATDVQTTGGVIRISGTNFLSGATVTVSGGIGYLGTATVLNSGSLEVTIPAGVYTPGLYDVTVANPDQESVSATAILQVVASADPWSILGNNCIGWYRADNIASPTSPPVTGSSVSGMVDISRLKNDAIQSTGGNQPTWNSANTGIDGQPSVHFAGSQFLDVAAFNLSANTGNTIYVWIVYGQASAPASEGCFVAYANGEWFDLRVETTGKPRVFWDASNLTWGTSLTGGYQALLGYATSTNTTTPPIGINVSNGTAITGTGSQIAIVSGDALSIGGHTDGTITLNGCDIAEIVIANGSVTSGQLLAMQSYFSARYGV